MMETLQKRPRLLRLVVVVAIIAGFSVMNTMLKPKPVTRSDNKQFDDWVRYFMRQPGYTVEYLDFDTFEVGFDVVTIVPAVNSLADHITLLSLGPDWEEEYQGAVRTQRSGKILEALKVRNSGDYPATVYYDDETLNIFYLGLGPDPDLSYVYYSNLKGLGYTGR